MATLQLATLRLKDYLGQRVRSVGFGHMICVRCSSAITLSKHRATMSQPDSAFDCVVCVNILSVPTVSHVISSVT
jgi:hypothetical protein